MVPCHISNGVCPSVVFVLLRTSVCTCLTNNGCAGARARAGLPIGRLQERRGRSAQLIGPLHTCFRLGVGDRKKTHGGQRTVFGEFRGANTQILRCAGERHGHRRVRGAARYARCRKAVRRRHVAAVGDVINEHRC